MSDPVPTGKNKAGANVLRATFVISLVCGGAIVLLLASDGALAGPSLHACLLVACVIFGVAGLHTKSTIGARNSLLYTHVGIGALWIAVSFVFIMFILNLYVPSALVDRKTWVGHSIDVYYNGVQAEESTNVTNVATTSMSSSLSKTTASSPATSFFFGATATTSSSAVSAFQSNLSETQQDAPSATITTDPTPAPTTASTDDPSNTETATPESLQAQDGSRMQRRDDWSSTHTETPFLLKALPPLLGINMLSLACGIAVVIFSPLFPKVSQGLSGFQAEQNKGKSALHRTYAQFQDGPTSPTASDPRDTAVNPERSNVGTGYPTESRNHPPYDPDQGAFAASRQDYFFGVNTYRHNQNASNGLNLDTSRHPSVYSTNRQSVGNFELHSHPMNGSRAHNLVSATGQPQILPPPNGNFPATDGFNRNRFSDSFQYQNARYINAAESNGLVDHGLGANAGEGYSFNQPAHGLQKSAIAEVWKKPYTNGVGSPPSAAPLDSSLDNTVLHFTGPQDPTSLGVAEAPIKETKVRCRNCREKMLLSQSYTHVCEKSEKRQQGGGSDSGHDALVHQGTPMAGKRMKVLRRYNPKLKDELYMEGGDYVDIEDVFEDGWGVGVNATTGDFGAFPLSCLVVSDEGPLRGRVQSMYGKQV